MDGNSATRAHSLVLRQAQHERSDGLFTTRKFAFSVAMPPLNRSTGASQNAILTVRLEPHDTPTLPFALSLSKGEWELRNSHPFARTSTGSARTEPRPRHHTKVCIQPRNAPTKPFAWSITKRQPFRSPGASRYTNLTVRLELVERWTGTPQLARIPSYFDGLSTNGGSDFSGTLNGDVIFRSRGDRTREDSDHDVARHRPDTG